MIKNASPSKAKYLALQHLDTPTLDDVPQVRAALEQAGPQPSWSALRAKQGQNGYLFLSNRFVDWNQTPGSYTSSLSGADEHVVYRFFEGLCTQVSHDRTNTQAVRKAATELLHCILAAQLRQSPVAQVIDTPQLRERLVALDRARKAQNKERQTATPATPRQTLTTFTPDNDPLAGGHADGLAIELDPTDTPTAHRPPQTVADTHVVLIETPDDGPVAPQAKPSIVDKLLGKLSSLFKKS